MPYISRKPRLVLRAADSFRLCRRLVNLAPKRVNNRPDLRHYPFPFVLSTTPR
jgi:hypothetical protein